MGTASRAIYDNDGSARLTRKIVPVVEATVTFGTDEPEEFVLGTVGGGVVAAENKVNEITAHQ